MDILPFEKYIHSCEEKEYNRDVRKKNYIVKYAGMLVVDNLDAVSLRRFVMSMVFFRNTFSKDAFLYFFLEEFNKQEKKLLSNIVYEMFVRSEKGQYGEFKDFLKYAYELYGYIDYEHPINDIWEELKKDFESLI